MCAAGAGAAATEPALDGLPARALRHPEHERQSLVDVLVPVVEKILGEPFRGEKA